MMKKFRFIDLFAGIGGFHIAMKNLGGECVFASEIDPFAIETYKANFNLNPANDIREIDETKIPSHEVLCAGFPCQAFSKAGKQAGFDDTRGTLFFEIKRILKYHRPKYIILENVRNLSTHDGGRTWKIISKNLKELGYVITEKPLIVSPHQVGVPQLRERVFILGVNSKYSSSKELKFQIPPSHRNQTVAREVLVESSDEFRISKYEEYVLEAWDEFIKGVGRKKLGFPIWANEFKESYDLIRLPKWKATFVEKNRNLYFQNKDFIDKWLKKYNNLSDFVKTHTKFEWQAGDDIESIWDGIIQFRPSGIRVKRPTEFPALVAMVHIPIVGWQKRRLTPREVANLQSFPPNFIINPNKQQAYKQFGNSVNVQVVEFLANQLFNQC
ncbi:DNA cytosine methyltransferase [Tenuifilum thalassicum]|uniref:Cytosine-specific methyltransferase n=1 Tax=Tenuifilum thalassicum TaxID=2590900 RepID=A0A7D3XDU9_9BACT|nr:DNA cytosine methyltransferase [Tenuifilum thalassicum]QKG79832.1 DNA cytosine methyltransferase [Tenuifilum thalassicum]